VILDYENPFPDREAVIHELGHLFLSCLFSPRTDGISFYPRHPDFIAVASYSRDKVIASRMLKITVAGAVAVFDCADAARLGPQPPPEEVFLNEAGNGLRQFRTDRELAGEYAAKMARGGPSRPHILRAIASARRELTRLNGAELLIAVSEGILRWLEADNRARWLKALEIKNPHTTVFFNANHLRDLLAQTAADHPALVLGTTQLVTLLDQQRQNLEQARQRQQAIRNKS
jgi:hypothetical protein